MLIALASLAPLLLRAEPLDDETDGLELIPQHTVHPPFLAQYWKLVRGGVSSDNLTSSSVSTSGGIGNWDFGASTILTNDRIALNSGWFRNVNKLHSIFTDGWRVILRLQYSGAPEVPLIFTYSTMKGNYPFMWTEIELNRGQHGAQSLSVKTGGLNVTQGAGTYPLPARSPKSDAETLEVQFLYNRRLAKLLVSVGEGGAECLRVDAELEDGYHFGLQSSPPAAPTLADWRWYLQGFYFTSLPHHSFIQSGEGRRFGESSPFSGAKSRKTDSMHQFIQSREHRERKSYEHTEAEEREQASYTQRIAEAQRRRVELEERWRKEQQNRRASDLYAADEDDDDDDDDAADSAAEKAGAPLRERMRRRIFDHDMEVTDADYDAEYDTGGMVSGGSNGRRRRRYNKHQVVNPSKAPARPPQRKNQRVPPQAGESAPPPVMQTPPPPVEMPQTPPPPPQQQQTPPPLAPPAQPIPQQQPPNAPPAQQANAFQQPPNFPNQFAQPQNPPPPQYAQYPYGPAGQFYGPPGQQPVYANPQGGYAPTMPPQQMYQQPPPQYQQYAYQPQM